MKLTELESAWNAQADALSVGLESLPKPLLLRRVMPDDYRYGDVYGYTGKQMLAYAKRCVAAERAAFDAYAAAPIAENASTNSWQPIETAPKDDTRVDLWRPWIRSDGRVYGGERCTNMRRVELAPDNIFYSPDYSGPSCVRDATHWMPIPEPPK